MTFQFYWFFFFFSKWICLKKNMIKWNWFYIFRCLYAIISGAFFLKRRIMMKSQLIYQFWFLFPLVIIISFIIVIIDVRLVIYFGFFLCNFGLQSQDFLRLFNFVCTYFCLINFFAREDKEDSVDLLLLWILKYFLQIWQNFEKK